MLMQIGRRSSSALNRVTRPTPCNFTGNFEVITSENYSLQNLINSIYRAIWESFYLVSEIMVIPRISHRYKRCVLVSHVCQYILK